MCSFRTKALEKSMKTSLLVLCFITGYLDKNVSSLATQIRLRNIATVVIKSSRLSIVNQPVFTSTFFVFLLQRFRPIKFKVIQQNSTVLNISLYISTRFCK